MLASFQRAFWLGVVTTLSGGSLCLAEGVRGRPIEFSEPRQERGKTESGTLLPGQTRLDQLESDLASPFKSFVPGKSLDGMMFTTPPPLPPPAVSSPRARELNNNKRDWMFRTPEELFSIQTVEDKYKAPELTPDGRDQKDVRPMERAYMNVLEATWSAMATNAPAQRFDGGYGTLPGNLQSSSLANPLSGTASQLENNVRRAFGGNAGFGSSRSTDAADFFKFNNGNIPNKPSEAQMQRGEAYMRILDFNNSLPDATTASSGGVETYQSPYASPYVNSSFFDPPKPAVPAPSSSLGGGLNGSPVNSGSTPSWSTPVTPPAPEPVRVAPPSSSPFFNTPRRNF